MKKIHRSSVAFCLGFLLFSVGFVSAQEPTEQNASSRTRHEASRPIQDAEAQLAKESREAAGEEAGENDQLKKSPAVQFVARITGLDIEHAYWLCMGLNFAVIAGVIVWFSRSRLPGLFRSRTDSIQKAMQEARKASDEANRRLADIEARLSKLDAEIAGMRDQAEKEAAAEEARILAAAEEDRRKIVAMAEQEIVAAAKAARRDLKAYAADLAVGLAQRQIEVDAATDQALVRGFAEQLDHTNGSGKDGR